MAYQFVHIQTYCPKHTKVAGTKDQYNSIEQVLAEAERDLRYSAHVPEPGSPIHLQGFGSITVAQLRKRHDERRAAIKETVTKAEGTTYQRGLKSDFPTLYSEIHSHPMTVADYKLASKEEKLRVRRWASLALRDFSERMPAGVEFAAVLHLDESHVHFHILAVNMADPKLSANKLHVGKVAAEGWRQEHGPAETLPGLPKPEVKERPRKPKKPKPSKTPVTQKKRDAAHLAALAAWELDCIRIDAENEAALKKWQADNNAHLRSLRKAKKSKTGDVEAYEAALVAFQDRYYEAVGRESGLLRVGPRAERLPTKQYAARKQQARLLADQAEGLKEKAAMQGKAQAQFEADLSAMAEKKRALLCEQDEIEAARADLIGRETRVARQQASCRAAEVALAQQAQDLAAQQRTLHAERRGLAGERAAFNQDMQLREAALHRREEALAEKEVEMATGFNAMSDMIAQLESGGLSIERDRLVFDRPNPFLQHTSNTRPELRSPMQRLLVRFVVVLKRAVGALSGGRAPRLEDQAQRPEA